MILRTDSRNVVGLTTAATIWVAAALGISCAVGEWRVAGSAVVIALVVLVVGREIESALHRMKGDRATGTETAGTGNREPGTKPPGSVLRSAGRAYRLAERNGRGTSAPAALGSPHLSR